MANQMLGERHTAREYTSLNAVTAYRLISPPMLDPAIHVVSRPGSVGYFSSIMPFSVCANQSIVVRPRPRM